MSGLDTKQGIIRTLRSTDEPALSAKKLAEKLDVSVRTINNHVEPLEEEARLATTQIGNAMAYYIPFEDLPAHKKPDHTCARCGREVNEVYDFAKIETQTYFHRGNHEPDLADFYIFCRFCYSDFTHWVHDPAAIGDYPGVHSWELPSDQLEEVREDSDTRTAPENDRWMPDDRSLLYEFIRESEYEYDSGVPEHEIIAQGEEQGMIRSQAKKALGILENGGYIFKQGMDHYKTAK